jgi:hypothetical protein
MFLAASASHVNKSIEPKAPGAGQQPAPLRSTNSSPRFFDVIMVAFSIPGYRFGIIHPRKNDDFNTLASLIS